MEWQQLRMTILNIDWVAVSSIAAVIVAIAAVLIVIVENKRDKFILGLKMLLELSDHFNSDSMLETRRKAAVSLLDGSYDDENVENLLDFFEMVGYLLKHRAINRQVLWCNISYWIIHYWYAAEIHIERKQQKIPARWENIRYLFRIISKIERKKHGISVITNESIKTFLKKERGAFNK